MCSVMGADAVVFATRTLVPITTFANLSDSCALADDNGQTFSSDSFGNTYFNALNGQHGEAARIAAVESMHKLMADYNRQCDEPIRH
jgi:hypothetical protein